MQCEQQASIPKALFERVCIEMRWSLLRPSRNEYPLQEVRTLWNGQLPNPTLQGCTLRVSLTDIVPEISVLVSPSLVDVISMHSKFKLDAMSAPRRICLSYQVFFSHGFDFSTGGKLPGIGDDTFFLFPRWTRIRMFCGKCFYNVSGHEATLTAVGV